MALKKISVNIEHGIGYVYEVVETSEAFAGIDRFYFDHTQAKAFAQRHGGRIIARIVWDERGRKDDKRKA